MKNQVIFAVVLLFAGLFLAPVSEAACGEVEESATRYHIILTNDCTVDNEILFTTYSLTQWDFCFLMSTTGSVTVEVSLDGVNFSTSDLALSNYSSTDSTKSSSTAAGVPYAFPAKFLSVRVRQNGGTAAAASLICGTYGA